MYVDRDTSRTYSPESHAPSRQASAAGFCIPSRWDGYVEVGPSATVHLECFGVAAGGFFGDSAGFGSSRCRGGVV